MIEDCDPTYAEFNLVCFSDCLEHTPYPTDEELVAGILSTKDQASYSFTINNKTHVVAIRLMMVGGGFDMITLDKVIRNYLEMVVDTPHIKTQYRKLLNHILDDIRLHRLALRQSDGRPDYSCEINPKRQLVMA